MNTTRIWFRAWGRLVSLAVLAAKAAVTVGIVGASSSTGLQSATQGRLCFTIEDSQRIRDDVLRRSPQPPQTELQNETSAAYSAASSCASSGKTAIRTMSVLRLIPSGSDHQTQLTVWVYNRYPVPADLLRIALRQTATIFEHAGIRIGWLNCLPAGPQEPTDPACLPGPRSNTIVLTILGHANGGYRRSLDMRSRGVTAANRRSCTTGVWDSWWDLHPKRVLHYWEPWSRMRSAMRYCRAARTQKRASCGRNGSSRGRLPARHPNSLEALDRALEDAD